MHSVGDQGAHTNAAVARCKLHQAAALDTARARQLRRHFDESVGRFGADAGTSVGQIAFVKMFQQTPVIQMQIELGIPALLRFAPCYRKQARFAVRECEAFGVEQRLIAPSADTGHCSVL